MNLFLPVLLKTYINYTFFYNKVSTTLLFHISRQNSHPNYIYGCYILIKFPIEMKVYKNDLSNI